MIFAVMMMVWGEAPATVDGNNAKHITITHRTAKGTPCAFFRAIVVGFMRCSGYIRCFERDHNAVPTVLTGCRVRRIDLLV